jgi:hypothetical protein
MTAGHAPGSRCRASAARRAAAVLAGAVLAACAAGSPDRAASEYLEEATGTTITQVAVPLILFRDDPTLAANVRDYVYAAPLAVNRGGQRSYWMWLGLWSTIDRGVSGGDIDDGDVTGVQLLLDGEPVELDVSARLGEVPGVRRVPYSAPVSSARNLFVPLTASQVARLGRARTVAIRTGFTGQPARLWQPWTVDGSGLKEFAELALAQPAAKPVTATAHDR